MRKKLNYDILVASLNDYHEELFGESLMLHGEPRAVVEETLYILQAYVNIMGSTFGGREVLRNMGWDVKEVEPELQKIAAFNDVEFERNTILWDGLQ